MRVRAGTTRDAPAIAAVEQAAAHRPWSLDAVVTHLGDANRCTWVAEVDGRVVGSLLASAVADEGEVLTISVHPTARRRGLGRALLGALYAEWAERKIHTGWLEVRDDNVPAVTLYRKDGWEDAGRRKAYYHDGVDALVMRREVP